MGLRFVLGRSGSGKSTYILDEIKKEAQKMKRHQLYF